MFAVACVALSLSGCSADGPVTRDRPVTMKWLYPYDGTVFPRGMLAPDIMWEGPPADAVYIHIKSAIFEYWGCLKPVSPNRITLPQDAWERAGERSGGKSDFYTVELSMLSLAGVSGPTTSKFQIAQAAIKGSIYYNTYRSNLMGGGAAGPGAMPFPGFPPGGGIGGANGIVVRIPAGGRAEVFGQTDCNGCHSVSADGSLLLAQSFVRTDDFDFTGGGIVSLRRSCRAIAPEPHTPSSRSSTSTRRR
jgi:hypothetical protein